MTTQRPWRRRRRAHLVIFLCDGDLTRSQARQLKFLRELDKPLVLALNKADRYDRQELQSLLAEIQTKTGLDPAEHRRDQHRWP